MRETLLLRLVGASVLTAAVAVAATASLAEPAASGSNQALAVDLTDDAGIYTALLHYAATHSGWRNVGPTVQILASRTGRRIVLLSADHQPLADSADGHPPLPPAAPTVVDPLRVDRTLAPADASGIDPDAVGPYQLTAPEEASLRAVARRIAACIDSKESNGTTSIAAAADGHPTVIGGDPVLDETCGLSALQQPTPTETNALDSLEKLSDTCLSRESLPPVTIATDYSWEPATPAPAGSDQPYRSCIMEARRRQLEPFVAPAALLYVADAPGTPADRIARPSDRLHIGLAVTAVLALAAAVTLVLAGLRLVIPLQALTIAVRRIREGDETARVRVRGRDEIARLGSAFNEMAEHKERTERLRRARVDDVAHELRSPLGNIRGWLEAVDDGIAEPDPVLISSLLEETQLLEHVVSDLQDPICTGTSGLMLRREILRVSRLLEAAHTAHRAAAEAAGIALKTACTDHEIEINADPLRMRQALDNLIVNALRHTPGGGVVCIEARADLGAAVIEVTDTGSGIAPGELPFVFDRHWRAESSRVQQTAGHGLGLSLVRRLVDAHGGTVSVRSAPHRGSTFTIRIPALELGGDQTTGTVDGPPNCPGARPSVL